MFGIKVASNFMEASTSFLGNLPFKGELKIILYLEKLCPKSQDV